MVSTMHKVCRVRSAIRAYQYCPRRPLFRLVYNASWPVVEGAVPQDPITLMGQELLTTYVVPFEIASVLLLAALVGSILIGREKDQESRSAE